MAVLYVPDQDTNLEDEALRITGNPLDDSCNNASYRYPNPCMDPSSPDYGNCGGGGGGGGGGGTNPPPVDTKKPAGQILVRDVINNTTRDVAVRRVRVVARRWFKIELMYTDDNGVFQSTKRFKNKVNVFVKFKNNLVSTRGLRGIRVWQSIYPIKHGLGKYSGNLSNIPWTYSSAGLGNERSNRNWWAAQLMNAYLEFNENAAVLNIGTSPSDMRILLTNWGGAAGTGYTPMNHHRSNVNSITSEFLQQFVVQPGNAFWGQVYNNLYNNNGIIRHTDMTLGYNTRTDRAPWTSDRVKQLMYHELGHSSHFNKVGQTWWSNFVYAESYEIARFGTGGANSPYGIGDDGSISDYILLAESWAEHVGQTIADRMYGANSTGFAAQNGSEFYVNNIYIAGSSHINYLEDFNPFRTADPFRWIPDGLYYDLIDNRNDRFFFRVNIDDAVFGYTNQQMFDALDDDVRSLPQFRARLLSENGNYQAAEVTQLFNGYGY